MEIGRTRHQPADRAWRSQGYVNAQAIDIASKLVDVSKKLDHMGTLTYEYAGYSRVVVDRTGEGIQTRFETCEPVIPAPPDHLTEADKAVGEGN